MGTPQRRSRDYLSPHWSPGPALFSDRSRDVPPIPPDPLITVERNAAGRVVITVERRRRRSFSLSLDEAELLDRLLRRELPELTATRRA